MYSWAGPGSSWIRKPDPPSNMYRHTMVYDPAHHAIWALTVNWDHNVYKYSLGDGLWQTEQPPLLEWRSSSASVLCGANIMTFGGIEGPGPPGHLTNTILRTDVTSGQTITVNTTLPTTLAQHCAVRVTPTRS